MDAKRSFKYFLIALASATQLLSVAKADTRTTEDGTPPSSQVYKLSEVGGVNGGGGNIECAEYSDLFNEFAGRLKSAISGGLFRASLTEEQEQTLLNSISEHMKNFRCIPVERLDRDARTNRSTAVSHLLTPSWEKKTDTKKKRIVAHEVCMLFGLEGEGDYEISRSLMGLWKN